MLDRLTGGEAARLPNGSSVSPSASQAWRFWRARIIGGSTWPIIEVLLVATCYAIAPLIAARHLADVPALPMTAVCLGFAAVVYAAPAAATWPTEMPSTQVLLALGGLAVICTALAFIVFFALIREVGAARALVFTYINPAVALAAGVIVLNEPLTAWNVAALCSSSPAASWPRIAPTSRYRIPTATSMSPGSQHHQGKYRQTRSHCISVVMWRSPGPLMRAASMSAGPSTRKHRRTMLRHMLMARGIDDEAGLLQNQGAIDLWLSCRGQEAAQVGSAMAIGDEAVIFPSYREHAVAVVRGIDAVSLVAQWAGRTFCGWNPRLHRFFPVHPGARGTGPARRWIRRRAAVAEHGRNSGRLRRRRSDQ